VRLSRLSAATAERLESPDRSSYARLAVAETVATLGVLALLCALLGLHDDGGDAAVLAVGGIVALGLGVSAAARFSRRVRPTPGRIISGLAVSWLVLVALGAAAYLVTGTIDQLDEAVVESAAGFGTTAVTTVDPEGLTVPMQLFRAATQWFGGLIGVVAGVVSLPLAFRGRYLAINSSQQNPYRLAPTPEIGRRRVGVVYVALTLALGLAYLLTGMGGVDGAVHAMTTISTGGFSSHADSFVGFGTGPRVVATIGMIVGGASFFVLWWLIRGRLTPVWRSAELRLYVALLVGGAAVVWFGGEGVSFGDAVFISTSALSTTGFAVGDWTLLDDAVLTVLLVLIGTGAMSGSAGGGLRVIRAWMLLGFARRELWRQLDPHSVAVVKQGGNAIDEATLERNTGYQIGHLGLCAVAAFALAATGLDVTAAIYTGVSVISTFGPGIGAGPFGDISSWSPAARLVLLPFLLAGRLSILPLLMGVTLLFSGQHEAVRRTRRVLRRVIAR
jgi:trk system potassium uptake protein TrkH